MAMVRSAMPGPWSSTRMQTPRRPARSIIRTVTVPAPACSSTFLTSSLAAVSIFVLSTSPSSAAAAILRIALRTRSASPSSRTDKITPSGRLSVPLFISHPEAAAKEPHPLVHVQGGEDPRQR